MSADLEAYKQAFGIQPINRPLRARALELALDIRKFEITLYWQRATYFWALIAAAFAGYFAILAAEKMHDAHFNAFVVACIGLVFSLAWFLANRGSKFWQENWENHVDMLEDEASGPLYKTVLQGAENQSLVGQFVDGPLPISVSRVNQWVSLFTVLIWPLLAWNVLPVFSSTAAVSVRHVLVGGLTIVVCVAMVLLTRSNIGSRRSLRISTREVLL